MNREQALQYYKQACELGGNYGCYNVKYAYQYGDGVAKDSAQANKYAKKMNLDNLLIEQEYIDKFSQEIFTAKYWPIRINRSDQNLLMHYLIF